MEHILISPGKLKLMLTKSDLDKYELDCASLDSQSTLTRRAFRALLSDVKRIAGFDTVSDKVFIQLYPSRDGGAEIYITRLGGEGTTANVSTLTDVYRFASMSALLAACSHADADTLPSECSAWYGSGAYYLIVGDTPQKGERKKSGSRERFTGCMSAFGRMLSSDAASAYVYEHCECIACRDAVTTLARLA